MIQDRSNLHSYSHYFDDRGFIQDVNPTVESDPQPIQFSLNDGRVVSLFLVNNPWRATLESQHAQMVYQYCVFCRDKRFENDFFSGSEGHFLTVKEVIRPGGGESLFTCRKLTCLVEKWFDLTNHISDEEFYSFTSLRKIHRLPEIRVKEQLL